MDIEAAKKRSIDGVVETHYRNIVLRGKIKFFNAKKGYGFMYCTDKQERFFHIKDAQKGMCLDAGETVNCIGIHTLKGQQAVQIIPAEPLSLFENIKLTFFDDWADYCIAENQRLGIDTAPITVEPIKHKIIIDNDNDDSDSEINILGQKKLGFGGIYDLSGAGGESSYVHDTEYF